MLQAVIMAAGKSTRTYPLTLTKPKPLLRIANTPILAHQLDQFVGLAQEAIIIVGYKSHKIRAEFGDSYRGITLGYVEQQEQLGTGHAALQVRPYIRDRFVLLNGDDLYARQDIEGCLQYPYALLGHEVPDVRPFSELIVKDGIVQEIVEKPDDPVGNLTSVGLYVLDHKIFDILSTIPKSPRGEYELPDAIERLTRLAPVHCHVVEQYWIPVGYPWHILNANDFLLERNMVQPEHAGGVVEDGVSVSGNLMIGAGSLLRQGSYVKGHVRIGRDCVIGPNCTLTGNTAIGDGCAIGAGTVIENSVIDRHCRIAPFCYLSHTIFGEEVVAGSGLVTMSAPLDTKIVTSVIKGELVASDRERFGVTVGDCTIIHPHVVTYPGVKIDPEMVVSAGAVVKEDVINEHLLRE